jgi:CRP-like cAMP-binding protein
LALLKPGEIFGELEVVDENLRGSQSQAHTEVEICILGRQHLLQLMLAKPEMGIRMSKLIGFRRQVIESHLGNLVFKNVLQRLTTLLVELTSQFGQKEPDGIRIDVPLTHQDIADLIGASRATVTEVLDTLQKKGLLQTKRKFLKINKLDEIERLSGYQTGR